MDQHIAIIHMKARLFNMRALPLSRHTNHTWLLQRQGWQKTNSLTLPENLFKGLRLIDSVPRDYPSVGSRRSKICAFFVSRQFKIATFSFYVSFGSRDMDQYLGLENFKSTLSD